MKTKCSSLAIMCGMCALMLGCKSYDVPEVTPFDAQHSWVDEDRVPPDKVEYGMPYSLAAVWVDSILTRPGSDSVRGFGGRIFFYDERGMPIRVQGELTIYAYDDTFENSSSKVADKKFVFRETELQTHYAHCELGPTYNFWIPWGPLGGPRTTLALLPILVTPEGRTIRGEQSLNVLPGTVVNRDDERILDAYQAGGTLVERVGSSSTRIRTRPNRRKSINARDLMTRQVNHEEDFSGPLDGSIYNVPNIESATIPLSPALAYQMRQSQGRRSSDYSGRMQQQGFAHDPSRSGGGYSNLGQPYLAPPPHSGNPYGGMPAGGQMYGGQGTPPPPTQPMIINRSGTGSPTDSFMPGQNRQGFSPGEFHGGIQGGDAYSPTTNQGTYSTNPSPPRVFGQPGAITSSRSR